MRSPDTLAAAFHQTAEDSPDIPFLMVRCNGAYHTRSLGETAARVRSLAAGLVAHGVQPGDRVGILSENRQEWVEADLAVLTVGAITVALHAPLTSAQVRAQFADSGVRVVFVSTPVQSAKIREARPGLSALEAVYAFDAAAAEEPEIRPIEALCARGADLLAADPGLLAPRLAGRSSHDVAAIIYTSGTTGESKGAMLTHANFLSNARAIQQRYPIAPGSVLLNYLPVSHIYARTVDLYRSFLYRLVLALAECVEKLPENLQEVRPHYMSSVPRVLQKLIDLARPALDSGNPGALRDILGGRILFCGGGGAAVSPDVIHFFEAAGVPLYQGYGLTETSPVISMNYEGCNMTGSVGPILDGVEVRIAEDGEILTRGPHVMRGYWNNPSATAEAIDSDGWFHTGDIGKLDANGFLYITDRKKELLVTAYGKNVAPQLLEGLLGFDPLIDQACVFGDARPYLAALLVPAQEPLQAWAREQGLADLPWQELLQHPITQALYAERVRLALKDLASYEQVRRFALLPEPFSVERGELTLTLKLKRRGVAARWHAVLESLYAER